MELGFFEHKNKMTSLTTITLGSFYCKNQSKTPINL